MILFSYCEFKSQLYFRKLILASLFLIKSASESFIYFTVMFFKEPYSFSKDSLNQLNIWDKQNRNYQEILFSVSVWRHKEKFSRVFIKNLISLLFGKRRKIHTLCNFFCWTFGHSICFNMNYKSFSNKHV